MHSRTLMNPKQLLRLFHRRNCCFIFHTDNLVPGWHARKYLVAWLSMPERLLPAFAVKLWLFSGSWIWIFVIPGSVAAAALEATGTITEGTPRVRPRPG